MIQTTASMTLTLPQMMLHLLWEGLGLALMTLTLARVRIRVSYLDANLSPLNMQSLAL